MFASYGFKYFPYVYFFSGGPLSLVSLRSIGTFLSPPPAGALRACFVTLCPHVDSVALCSSRLRAL
ncbi:hypothetical protein GY45DRAFT_1321158 [Cubamyces sp. BRFM 1775]|nr:hypothetical protein GY45DRAFT_1321158 [Cubamyces sp. BRFM 1775]